MPNMKFFTLLAGLSLAVCVVAMAQSSLPIVVKHDAGETRIPSRPKRVVILGPTALEVALVLGIQPVGYGAVPPYVPEDSEVGQPIKYPLIYTKYTKGQPIFIGSSAKPSFEVITSLKPDLIVYDARSNDLFQTLDDIAPIIAFNFSKVGAANRALEAVALATGRQRQAVEVKRNLARTASINKTLLQGVLAKGKRMNIFLVTNAAVFRAGLQSDIGQQLTSLGFEVVGATKDSNLDLISLESLPLQRANIGLVVFSANTPSTRRDKIMSLLKKSSVARVGRYDLRPDRLTIGPISEPLLLNDLTKLLR